MPATGDVATFNDAFELALSNAYYLCREPRASVAALQAWWGS
jgi:hypothetical protein